MAIAYANQVSNHRAVYFEATGDGATTALTVNHNLGVHSNQTATAFVVTAPVGQPDYPSGKGGHRYPSTATAAAVSSVTVTPTTVTVNTSAAIPNATKAYVVVLFDQTTT
jgi:hypothetical protein